MNVGENIRRCRREKDLKAEVVFEKIGVSQSTFSKIENNRCKIDVEILKNIAAVLEVDVVILMGIEGRNIKVEDSDKLIKSLENQIELLKEQNLILKKENRLLKERNKKSS
ncbi:helix-turn-helix domain-containing protein [Flavobacterium tructae]|uniref:helix-turn-helix domain-containing protein n=1 Tax=Flavobacterium tructae TaxID=1114873 RepID=UPI0035A8570E